MSGDKMERKERTKKVEAIADKLVIGEISTQEAAEELMKMMRIFPDEKPTERKEELKKLLIKRLKEPRGRKISKISREEFMDNAMKILCDMSDEEFEKQRDDQTSTFEGLNKDATLKWMKRVIEGGFVPWDIKVEMLL